MQKIVICALFTRRERRGENARGARNAVRVFRTWPTIAAIFAVPFSGFFEVGRVGRGGGVGLLREKQRCGGGYVPSRIFPSAASPFSVDLTGLRSPAVAG